MRGKRIVIVCLGIFFVLVNHSDAKEVKEVTCIGKVVDERDQPVAGIKVTLYQIEYNKATYSYDIKVTKETKTTADGSFSFSSSNKSQRYRYGYIVVRKEGLALGFDNWNAQEGDKELQIKFVPGKLLEGIVVDVNDKPVSDAKVSISLLRVNEGIRHRALSDVVTMKLFSTRTDEAGKFAFANIPSKATIGLIVEKAGRATVNTYREVEYANQIFQYVPEQTDIELVMPSESKIEGMVVDKTTGKPIAGIQLMIGKRHNRPYFWQKPIITREDGSFVIDALVADKHILQIVQRTEGIKEWVVEPMEVITETGKTKSDVKFELSKGGILEIVVKDATNKKSVEKAGIIISPRGASPTGIQTDKDGIARIRLIPGEYNVGGIQQKDYFSYNRLDAVTIEEGKTRRIEFQLTNQPRIAGIVRDEEGKPVSGVDISILPSGGRDFSTDSDGRFSINWNPYQMRSRDIAYSLVARHRQRNLATVVEIVEDEDIEALDVRLKPSVIVTGRVVDPNGEGIAGAQARVHLRFSNWSMTFEREPAKTDTEGTFEIKGIPAEHRYSIYAEAEDYGQQNVEIHTGDAVDGRLDVGVLKLALANLSVSGTVVDVNDTPLADVRIYCYGVNQPYHYTQTDAKGKFSIDKICAGRIELGANTSGKTQLHGSIFTEGGATDVKIVVGKMESSNRYLPKRPPSLVGKPLPELKDFDVELSPADTNSTMVLVCFWDMEQRPSRRCILELSKQSEELKQKGVTVVAVQASKIDENTLNDWLKKNNVSFPVGMIQSEIEKTKFAWGVRALPWLILTDNKHIVRADSFGINELNEKIKQ